jgi:glycosyltransferase involved in cell wall biosynthesis
VSEPDGGQAQAINKGFAMATGEVINWLGCDDLLLPGALHRVGRELAIKPDCDVLVGRCRVYEPKSEWIYTPTYERLALMPCINPIPQPSCFFRRNAVGRAHVVDEGLQYALDFELWNYLRSTGAKWRVIDEILSVFYMAGDNKTATGGEKIIAEQARVYAQYTRERVPLSWWFLHVRRPLYRWAQINGLSRRAIRPLRWLYTWILGSLYGMERVRGVNTWEYFLENRT